MKHFHKIINPFNGQVVGEAPIHKNSEIDQIILQSYTYRCPLSYKEKNKVIKRTIDTFKKEKLSIAKLITMETGLSNKGSVHEVSRAINCLKNCISQLETINNENLTLEYLAGVKQEDPDLSVYAEPLDLAVGITPFNHPLNLVIHKVGPAIVAGTPIVIKPSEKTPLTAFKLREILLKNGLPDKMFSIVSGIPPKAIVDRILESKKYDLIGFTGGVTVGKYIARKIVNSGNELKKYIPELGGNAIFIVMDDCDIVLAAKLALGAFENSGQRCTAIRRILLHKDVEKPFIDEFVSLAKKIKYGDPFNLENEMGTVISSDQASIIKHRVDTAIIEGAQLLIGNKLDGAVYSPTILKNVNINSELVKRETFGPVASIIKINNLNEVIEYISNDRFGLACGIATKSRKTAMKVFKNIMVGQFSWNGRPGYRTEQAPFGGFKDSGNGEKEGIVLMTKALRRLKVFYKH